MIPSFPFGLALVVLGLRGIGFFFNATPLFFYATPGWHKRGGIRIFGGGIKGGGIKISDQRGVA